MNRAVCFFIAVALIVTAAIVASATRAAEAPAPVATDPLKVARDLVGGPLSDYHYGDSGVKRINCVMFVLRVIKEIDPQLAGDAEFAKRVKIADVDGTNPKELNPLVDKSDPKIKGVYTALIDAHRGTPVALDEVKNGDFVQYWRPKADGNWGGHSGVVSNIRAQKNGIKLVRLIGAHLRPEPDGTIGENAPNNDLALKTGDDRRIFIVRMTP